MAPSHVNKKVIEDFIELYRSYPCLWQVKSKEYRDRDKREVAYKVLIEKLKEIDPDANKALVVRKINNLRSNVRKEKKKFEQSIKSGAFADEIYQSKLWYYELFNFVHDPCSLRELSSNLHSEGENSCENDSLAADEEFNNVSTDDNKTQSSNHNSGQPSKPTKRKKSEENLENEELLSMQDHFKRPRSIQDRCDIIGKHVATKLKSLNVEQVLVAEKLINDLIFEAEVGHLSPEHAYINMRDVLRQSYVTQNPNNSFTFGSTIPPCLPFLNNQLLSLFNGIQGSSLIMNNPGLMQGPTIPRNRNGEAEAPIPNTDKK